jgi:hypothetical protein
MTSRRSSVDKSEAATAPETTSEPKGAAKGFRIWVIAGSSIFLGVVLSVAIALGIQKHNDRVLGVEVAQSESELRTLGAQIAAIKDHQFGTMSEYIAAYARVEPLLKDYDQKLQQYSELCSTAQQRDQKRGLINIQRLHSPYKAEVWRNNSELIELVRQVNEVTKKEASVIHDMASLPAQEQVQFWHDEFTPLAAQEHALRERLLLVGQRASPERATQ